MLRTETETDSRGKQSMCHVPAFPAPQLTVRVQVTNHITDAHSCGTFAMLNPMPLSVGSTVQSDAVSSSLCLTPLSANPAVRHPS